MCRVHGKIIKKSATTDKKAPLFRLLLSTQYPMALFPTLNKRQTLENNDIQSLQFNKIFAHHVKFMPKLWIKSQKPL